MDICSRKCFSSKRNPVDSVTVTDINKEGKILEFKKVREGYCIIPTTRLSGKDQTMHRETIGVKRGGRGKGRARRVCGQQNHHSI